MKVNLDSTGSECSSTTGVAELDDGNEGGVAKGRKQMGSTSRDGKEREVQIDLVGGDHNGVVGKRDMESG
jgi:hypothetical protein